MKKNSRLATKKTPPRNIRNLLRNKGYSLAGWSRANGYNVTSVWFALTGRMNGKRAKEIRSKVESL